MRTWLHTHPNPTVLLLAVGAKSQRKDFWTWPSKPIFEDGNIG